MMSIDNAPRAEAAGADRKKSIPLARLIFFAVKVTAAIVTVMVVAPWLPVITPRWVIQGASLAFLWSLLAAVILAAPAVVIAGVWSVLALAKARRSHDATALTRAVRVLLMASTCGVGLIATELVCFTMHRYSRRIPNLPTTFAGPVRRVSAGNGSGVADVKNESASQETAADELYLVVIGESSARGEPYHPWLSVGQLVCWQLESVFPGRKVRVDVRADGGLCLEQAVLLLTSLEKRPDAIMVFAGHNEFQARYGWSRNARHYVEEGPDSPLALLEKARSITSTSAYILSTIDRYYGEKPPPPKVTRELVDHPTCTPEEYAFLRGDFEFRLDGVTEYCTRVGALPILIMPGSNDGSFDPSRSVLKGATPAAARAAFASEFQAARELESREARAAIAAYRRLADQHPEFAETHYRLGRLLAAEGAWDEAARHFVLARDLDGLPLRCPSDFRAAYRTIAKRYHAMLIDGPEVLLRYSPHGFLDDELYHDAQHPNLKGIAALANDVLEQLQGRGAFGWPASVPAPRIELAECARHFGLDAKKWAEVCRRSQSFYDRTAYTRFDPAERLAVAKQYSEAADDIDAGWPISSMKPKSVAMAVSLLQAVPSGTAVGLPGAAPPQSQSANPPAARPPSARHGD
jgi:hypothetical protein